MSKNMHMQDWNACVDHATISGDTLEVNVKVLKCKQVSALITDVTALRTEVEELRKMLAETRDQVQALIDLNRMREIDANKGQYEKSVQDIAYPICD